MYLGDTFEQNINAVNVNRKLNEIKRLTRAATNFLKNSHLKTPAALNICLEITKIAERFEFP